MRRLARNAIVERVLGLVIIGVVGVLAPAAHVGMHVQH